MADQQDPKRRKLTPLLASQIEHPPAQGRIASLAVWTRERVLQQLATWLVDDKQNPATRAQVTAAVMSGLAQFAIWQDPSNRTSQLSLDEFLAVAEAMYRAARR